MLVQLRVGKRLQDEASTEQTHSKTMDKLVPIAWGVERLAGQGAEGDGEREGNDGLEQSLG
jgi:hypothetical protein